MFRLLEIFKFFSILLLLFLTIFYWKLTLICFSISIIILIVFAYYLEYSNDLDF